MVKAAAASDNAELDSNLFSLFNGIYALKDEEGYDIYPVFQALPDRKIADYYKTIKRPFSLNMIKNNLKKNRYSHPNEFILDLVQIVWNAKTYNLKDSDIYSYAVRVDNYIKANIITSLKTDEKYKRYHSEIVYPDLGPLPEDFPDTTGEDTQSQISTHSQLPSRQQSSQPPERFIAQQTKFKQHKQPSTPSTPIGNPYAQHQPPPLSFPQSNNNLASAMASSIVSSSHNSTVNSPRTSSYSTSRRNANMSSPQPHGPAGELTYEAWCKRGRPPIIDRPHEQRIKNIMRMMKKVKNDSGEFIHHYFDKLPDSKDYPEYYQVIPNPLSLDLIRVKIRQRSYATVEQFVEDLNLMFNNAKTYNSQSSQIFNDTLLLEMKAHELIKEEMKKPDSAYLAADGSHNLRIPLDQVDVNGRIYKIGDWILVRNPNDANKPIVAQLFRLWQTQDGKRWINVCWYYRPEQTVHRVDRLFYENEVCKSGQYRDHLADEIVGKCYVAYFTRFQRGDPGVQFEGPLFVCEYRYNDTDKQFNKIRTWKACLPDEVRHIEDPIIPLKSVRVMKKVESPLKHTLSPNASYSDPIPDPTLGHPNAPPLIGAVYLRPPDPKDDLGQYSTSTQPNKNNIPKAINNVKNVVDVPLPQRNLAANTSANLRKTGGIASPGGPHSLSNSPNPQLPFAYNAIPPSITGTSPSPANQQKQIFPSEGAFPFPTHSFIPPVNKATPVQPSPPVHHANSNYTSVSSNFSYTLPDDVEELISNGFISEAVNRMDQRNAQRRSGVSNFVNGLPQVKVLGKDTSNPIVWMRSPPLYVPSKIQPSETLTLSSLTRKARKRKHVKDNEGKEGEDESETNETDGSGEKKAKKDHSESELNTHTSHEEEVIDAPGYGFGGQWTVSHSAKYIDWRLKRQKSAA